MPKRGAETWSNNMGKNIAVQIGTAIIAVVISSAASAQMNFVERACPMGDETVMVEVRPVPNLKQRCYEIVYEKQRGHVCVWADGTPDGPYGFTRNFKPEQVTEQGWRGSGNLGCTADDCFRQLCRWLIGDHRREQARRKFDIDAATKHLDEFFNPQSPRHAPEDTQE